MNSINSEKENLVREYLRLIGENPDRPGLKDTPARIVKMWDEIYKGYDLSKKPNLTVFDNNDDGIVYNQMIIDTGTYYSQCEHHNVPFFGKYYFGYIPDKKIVGLSKIARIIDWYASKMQVQERLTVEVAEELWNALQPKGLILTLKGRHLCKEMRGAKQRGEMTTSEVRGVFENDLNARNEFLQLIKQSE